MKVLEAEKFRDIIAKIQELGCAMIVSQLEDDAGNHRVFARVTIYIPYIKEVKEE